MHLRSFAVAAVAATALASAVAVSASATPATVPPSPGCTRTPGASPMQALCQSIPAPGVRPLATSARPQGVPGGAGYTPTQLRVAYSIPASATSSATVAVVDAYNTPNIQSDYALYRANTGLGTCAGCLRVVNQNGGASLPSVGPVGWQRETALDVEMVSAICSKCHVLLVETNDDDRSGWPDLETGVDTAAQLGARYISMSWGRTENSDDPSWDPLFRPGIVYTSSAGDDGYGAIWPSTSARVTAVGGTRLILNATNHRVSETVWGNHLGATGSGCSGIQPKPVWQNSVVPASYCPRRAVVDVAMDSDPSTGVAIVSGGEWYEYGGTSAASPMVAAMYALAGTPLPNGFPSQYPYGNGQRGYFYDVTSGTNRTSSPGCSPKVLCYGARGWDGPTGLGAPIGLGGFRPAQGKVVLYNPGHQFHKLGANIVVSLRATDSKGYPLNFAMSGVPGMTINAKGQIVGRPSRAGTFKATVTARDASGGTAGVIFAWTTQR